MTLYRKRRINPDVNKAALYAVVVNAVQIGVILVFAVYALSLEQGASASLMLIVVLGAAMAVWGAAIDIADALRTRRRERMIHGLQQTNDQMEALNQRLRAQRHDFLNHIQVVYSLLEMGESAEAADYLERVYDELRSVSKVLRTRVAAFNALLQVKSAACEERGIALELDIQSALDDLAIPPWELCRVVANLLDNAMDAAQEAPSPRVRLRVRQELKGFVFSVSNNGPAIPDGLRGRLTEPGVSTKGEGRGMGLSIVAGILDEYGGVLSFQSGPEQTVFTFTLPKAA